MAVPVEATPNMPAAVYIPGHGGGGGSRAAGYSCGAYAGGFQGPRGGVPAIVGWSHRVLRRSGPRIPGFFTLAFSRKSAAFLRVSVLSTLDLPSSSAFRLNPVCAFLAFCLGLL